MTPSKRHAGSQADARRRDLAAIHAAAATLGMDTADRDPSTPYRTVVRVQGREDVTSAAELTAAGRRRVLAYLLEQGRLAGRGAPPPRPRTVPASQLDVIRGLWAQLGTAGALRDPSAEGLTAFVKRTTGVDAPRWLTAAQGSRVIEALKAWLARAKASAHAGT